MCLIDVLRRFCVGEGSMISHAMSLIMTCLGGECSEWYFVVRLGLGLDLGFGC